MNKNQIAKKYGREKIIFEIFSIVLNIILFFILGKTAIGEMIETGIKQIFINGIVSFLAYALISTALIFLINMIMIDFYTGYFMERKYNMSNEDLKGWIFKKIKEFLLTALFTLIIMGVFYYFLLKVNRNWWIYFFIFMIVFNIFLGMIAPVVIFPLFYKFSPIENEEIKNAIIEVTKKSGVMIKGIYKFDMSKETKKANAAFTGIGKTKRIIIGDTLLQNFTINEIKAVFSHEMGHFVKKHILKMVILSSIIMLCVFYILSFVEIKDYSLYRNIFILGFYLMIIQNILMVFDNWYSRKNEIEADRYAKEIMGEPESLISALDKLKDQNLSDAEPNKIIEFIFYSHPSVKKRIEYLRGEKN